MTESILKPSIQKSIDHWLDKFPQEQKRSALLMALRVVQDEYGWLSDASIDAVANYLELPPVYAYEVVEFYSLYRRKKPGKHVIKICTSISCHLCSSQNLIQQCEEKLGITIGNTTPDGLLTLEETECIAACAGAPALLVDDKHYHESVDEQKLNQIIQSLKNTEVST